MGKLGQKSETSKQAPTRKTKAAVDRRHNNRMLSQCPSGIAQRPQHHAVDVPTPVQSRVTKTLSIAPPVGNNWSKRSPTLSLWPSTTSLLLISSGLASSWESSSPPSSWSRLDSHATPAGMDLDIHVHVRRHLPSAVPWNCEDHLLPIIVRCLGALLFLYTFLSPLGFPLRKPARQTKSHAGNITTQNFEMNSIKKTIWMSCQCSFPWTMHKTIFSKHEHGHEKEHFLRYNTGL